MAYDPAAMMREEYERRITEIYQQQDSTKIDKIDGLLDKYAGKEHTLYMKICQKYREPIMGRYKPEPPSEEEEEESEDELDSDADEDEDEEEEESEDFEEDDGPQPTAWHRLIRQTTGNWFEEGQTEASEHDLFCELGRDVIETYRQKKGHFKFMLTFPNMEEDRPYEIKNDENGTPSINIVWTQEENPHEASTGGVEVLVNHYGEAFDGICYDEDTPCFFTGGALRVGLFEAADTGQLCGPLDEEWGEPIGVNECELYVAVPSLICMPLRINTRDSNGAHHGKCEGNAQIKDGCLFLPNGDEPQCVNIPHHDNFKSSKKSLTVAMWFQKHYRGKTGACLVSKGNWRKNFSIVLNNQIDGDYVRGCLKTTHGVKKCQNKFKDISEFDLLDDAELNKFHSEDADLTWFHGALTLGKGVMQVWINGEAVCQQKAPAGLNHTSESITIGAEDGSTTILQGRMFDFVLFEHCLAAEEIRTLMESGQGRCAQIDESVQKSSSTKKKVANKGDNDRLAKMQARMAKRAKKKR